MANEPKHAPVIFGHLGDPAATATRNKLDLLPFFRAVNYNIIIISMPQDQN